MVGDQTGRYVIAGEYSGGRICFDDNGSCLIHPLGANSTTPFYCFFDKNNKPIYYFQLFDMLYPSPLFEGSRGIHLKQDEVYLSGLSSDFEVPDGTRQNYYSPGLNRIGGIQYIMKFQLWPLALENLREGKNLLRVFPNPSSSLIKCIPETVEGDKIIILSSDGREIMRHKYQESLDISTLPSGSYIYHLVDKTGKEYSALFTKY